MQAVDGDGKANVQAQGAGGRRPGTEMRSFSGVSWSSELERITSG